MTERADILLFGTGSFAARILFDLAATAPDPVTVVVAGRNAGRVAWLRTAAAARAAMFGRAVTVAERIVDMDHEDEIAATVATSRPRLVVQAASAQGGRVIAASDTAWSRLVAEGGLSTTAVFQARLSVRAARAVAAAAPGAYFVNCCYPDVVNGMIAGLGLPITSGIGNVAILATAFAGVLGPDTRDLRVLAQYQTLAGYRRPPAARAGAALPRVWIDGAEIADVAERFIRVQLTPEPVIDISGASGVPLFQAMAAGRPWHGHAPGPLGLPGGYPVTFDGRDLALDLPPGLARDAAIAWNAAFELRSGLVVDEEGRARYTGRLEEGLRRVSPDLAGGFALADLAVVDAAMSALRTRLEATT